MFVLIKTEQSARSGHCGLGQALTCSEDKEQLRDIARKMIGKNGMENGDGFFSWSKSDCAYQWLQIQKVGFA